jgi:hypothetical protein
MRLQVGSKVKFLNDVGGGVLKSFDGEKMALVETDEGFEVSVMVNELLPDTGTTYDFDGGKPAGSREHAMESLPEEKPVVTYEEKKYASFKGEAFLALVPHNENVLHVSNFGLFLVNSSNYFLTYAIAASDGKINTLVGNGTIEPDSNLEVEVYSQSSIAKVKDISLQGFFYKQGLFDTIPPINQLSTIGHISFYKIAYFQENEYFPQKALILKENQHKELNEAIEKLRASDLHQVVKAKEQSDVRKEHKSPKSQEIQEVDLHIEEILESTSGMSNAEMLEAQMARFETALETSMRSTIQRIVFIHGVGNGRLRQQLRKKLDRDYPNLRYQDASFKEYGYGATMVYLK